MQVGGANILRFAVNAVEAYFVAPIFKFFDNAFSTEYMNLTNYGLTVNGYIRGGAITSSGGITATGDIRTNGSIIGGSLVGAYMMDTGGLLYPIMCSLYDYGRCSMSNKDDYYIVFPGYRIEVYINNNWTGSPVYTVDQTTAYSIVSIPKIGVGVSANTGNSCKLFFNNVEVLLNGLSF
jgi:hypothetical protein